MTVASDDYTPFLDRNDFELADFLFTQDQMPGKRIDYLMNILADKYEDTDAPFADHSQMYNVIDSTELGMLHGNHFQ